MKSRFTALLDSVLQWLGLARRARPEPRPSPQQLRTALTEMLADPKIRRLVFQELIAPVFPIQGGACSTTADIIGHGDFGASCGPPDTGHYTFSNSRVGIRTTGPLTDLDVGGANRALGTDEHGIARIFSNSPYGINKGGSLSFAGKYNDAEGYATFASIWGLKETSPSGEFTGYLALATSPGGTPVERMRLSSTGNVGIGTSPSPSVRLHVYKGVSGQSTPQPGTNLLIENNSSNYLSFLNPNASEAGIVFGNAASPVDGFLTSQLNVGRVLALLPRNE